MHTKHKALTFVLLFIIVFLGLTVWYLATQPKHPANTATVATSTAATSTLQAAVPTPAHLAEHATYYDIDLQYPTGSVIGTQVSAQANAAAVAAMQEFAATTSAQFKTDGGFATLTHDDIQTMGLDQRKEALSSTYEAFASKRTVSYVFTVYEDTLGAHPNTFFRTFTFDSQTGAPLSIKDLFLPSVTVASALSTRTRADLPGIMKAKTGYDADMSMLRDGTTADLDNFANFYLTDTTLTLLFPPYQVAAYAAGEITDPMPLSSLSSLLKPEYR